MILTTRPTLLHLLIKLDEPASPSTTTQPHEEPRISQPVLTLSEACIHAARHSHSIILRKWFNGSLPVFGYFHAHYLFSSALALGMAGLGLVRAGANTAGGSNPAAGGGIGSASDLGAFETALEVLKAMSENGNLAASEFYLHLEAVRGCFEGYRYRHHHQNLEVEGNGFGSAGAVSAPSTSTLAPASTLLVPGGQPTPTTPNLPNPTTTSHPSLPPNPGPVPNPVPNPVPWPGQSPGPNPREGGTTTSLTFHEPTMADFLSQSDFDGGLGLSGLLAQDPMLDALMFIDDGD